MMKTGSFKHQKLDDTIKKGKEGNAAFSEKVFCPCSRSANNKQGRGIPVKKRMFLSALFIVALLFGGAHAHAAEGTALVQPVNPIVTPDDWSWA